MKRLLILLYLYSIGTVLLWASDSVIENVNDTVRLDEVIVTGTMPKVNLRNIPMSISIVTGNQIEKRMQPSILPLLTEEVPGLFISQRGVMGYGVAEGAAGGMSIRGIGGAPTAGVLVLIDGHPQYMGLMGHPLADSYQSMMTERVEVVRGPASMLYGSNAMGGVINIITKKQRSKGRHISAQVMYGSYNTLNTEVSGGIRNKKFSANVSIGHNSSDGHRPNMEFCQTNGFGKIGYNFSNNWSGFADLNLSKSISSNPGSTASLMIDNDADVLRGMTSAVLENEYSNTSGAIKFFYNFGSHKINNGHAINSSFIPDFLFRSNDQMLGISSYQSVSLMEGNMTTAGFDFQRFGGKAWNLYKDESKNVDLANVHFNNLAGYFNVQQSFLNDKFTANAGIRLDHHEKNGSEWIPQFGLSYNPTSLSSIKAIVSKGFRNPTIREMYMFHPQNSDLKSERLMNYEISLLQSLPDERFNFGVNLFYLKGDNMIRIQMIDSRPKYVNSGLVENKGAELSMNYQATNQLRFSANYSYLDMTYKLIGVPEHKFYTGGYFSHKKLSLSSGLQYLGNIYTVIAPEEIKENALLWNARADYNVLNWLNVFLRGENLLGQNYEINAGFPMPKTTIFGGIRVHI